MSTNIPILYNTESIQIPVVTTPVPLPITPAPPSSAPPLLAPPSPILVSTSLDPNDILYNKIILNTSLLILINNLKTKGFSGADIPSLILCIVGTYNNYTSFTPSHKLSIDDVQTLLERVYNYVVDKYNLIDIIQRPAMFELFDMSLKLCLETPNIKKDIKKCLNFFNCSK
jgi:hypothetical protein